MTRGTVTAIEWKWSGCRHSIFMCCFARRVTPSEVEGQPQSKGLATKRRLLFYPIVITILGLACDIIFPVTDLSILSNFIGD